MDIVLHDITAVAPPDEHSPELRAGLEELGWTVLGRVRMGTEEQIDTFVKGYDASLGPALLEKELIGATVMRDGDGTTFAFIDWFFHCPFTRLMTMLDDGRLVETHETWTSDPVQTTAMRAGQTFMSRRREQTRLAARGRSIALAGDGGPGALVATHRQHLADVVGQSGARPAAHTSLPQAMDLWDQQLRHGKELGKWVGRLAAVVSATLLLAIWVALLRGPTGPTDGPLADAPFLARMSVLVVLVVLSRHLTAALATPLFYVGALRPRFRGAPPAPRATTSPEPPQDEGIQ